MTLHHLLLFFTLSLARDELRAYDCRDPEILQVLKHNDFDQPHKDTQQISYNVLQESLITHLKGVSCELSISRSFEYCRAYSHTKPTSYSSSSSPTSIDLNQCRKIMEESIFIYKEHTLTVDINASSAFSLVTKGQITHSDANVTVWETLCGCQMVLSLRTLC